MFRHEMGNFMKRFVVIYGLTMLATYGFCMVFNPGVTVLVADYFGACILFSLLANATSLVYLSRRELTVRAWMGRALLQCVLLELFLMPYGYYLGMWRGRMGGIVFFVVVLVVQLCVHLMGYGRDCADATSVNARLRERREQQSAEDQKGDTLK